MAPSWGLHILSFQHLQVVLYRVAVGVATGGSEASGHQPWPVRTQSSAVLHTTKIYPSRHHVPYFPLMFHWICSSCQAPGVHAGKPAPLAGTRDYASPEWLLAWAEDPSQQLVVQPAQDIWAVRCCLLHCKLRDSAVALLCVVYTK